MVEREILSFIVDTYIGTVKISQMPGTAGAHDWGQMSDKDLESAARYYLWLMRQFPDLPNHRLDEIVAEVRRRGKPEILRHARASMSSKQADG